VPFVESTLQLETGEVRAEATVPAARKADVRIWCSVGTYGQWIGEDALGSSE